LAPELDDYKPTEAGDPPLARATEWVRTSDPASGLAALRETNTMPQWAGSCWYYLRFADPNNRQAPIAPEKEKYWLPVDLYVGGAEHAVLHLLYARFWHKVLYDIGAVSTKEPFQKLFNQGMILAFSYSDASGKYYPPAEVSERGGQWFAGDKPVNQQIEKMSKSKFNVVNPDEVIDIYGADSMRLYEMFMGPLDVAKPWQMSGVAGVSRFLHRVWRIVTDDKDGLSGQICEIEPPAKITRLMHKTIRSVGEDIEAMRFNTAISKLMEMSNALIALERKPRSVVEVFLLLLAPFAPHICEELWALLDHDTSLAYETWPIFDPALADDELREYVVQVNGILRHKVLAASGLSAADLIRTVRADPRVTGLLEGKQIVKEVAVPNRLVNFVVKN
jgi:leucyl-tRNA synthetase